MTTSDQKHLNPLSTNDNNNKNNNEDAPMKRESTLDPSTSQQQQQETVAAYLQKHRIHVLVDRLVRDLLDERPLDSSAWMQRWLLEEHRRECAEKHSRSPHATPQKQQQQETNDNDTNNNKQQLLNPPPRDGPLF